jgi:hypothetical protein
VQVLLLICSALCRVQSKLQTLQIVVDFFYES